MTIPNVFTIYFQEKHQKFLFGFERFGTELASIGMGNQEKTKTAGEPSRLSCGITIIQQIYDYGWGCSIGALERHTPNALYLLFFKPFPYFPCLTQFRIVEIDRYVKDNPRYGKRFTIYGNEIYARILVQPIR